MLVSCRVCILSASTGPGTEEALHKYHLAKRVIDDGALQRAGHCPILKELHYLKWQPSLETTNFCIC